MSDGEIINIKDEEIFKQILQQCNKKKPPLFKLFSREIKRKDIEKLKYISLRNIKITNFEFLNEIPEIDYLNIFDCDLSDIADSNIYSEIREISLVVRNDTSIKDINLSTISMLFPNLRYIELEGYENLSNASYLAALRDFSILCIKNCYNFDEKALGLCKELKDIEIGLYDGSEGNIDLSFIESLSKLESIEINGYSINDLRHIINNENVDDISLNNVKNKVDYKELSVMLPRISSLELCNDNLEDSEQEELREIFKDVEYLEIE